MNTQGPDINLNMTDTSHKWKTEGIAIVVAGITNVKLFVYDYIEKMVALEEDLDVMGDIGSYLNIMELVKKQKSSKSIEDNKEVYNMFLGTTEGEINIFELQFNINYHNPVLQEFGTELRAAGKELIRKSRRDLEWDGQDSQYSGEENDENSSVSE